MQARLPLAVLFVLAASQGWPQGTQTFSLEHRDAQVLADWMHRELAEKGEVAGVPAAQIEQIDCDPVENTLVVSAEEAAMDRIRALLAALDEPIGQIEIDCKMVELEQPELLLGGAPERRFAVEEGLTVGLPVAAIFGTAGQPPGAEDPGHGLLAINPHVDPDLLAELLESGRATLVNEPRIRLAQGAPGALVFVAEHEGEVYQKSVGFTAFMTAEDLVTVEAWLHFHEPPGETAHPDVDLAVRYTAADGQAVAIGVLPGAEATEGEPALVFVVTAELVREP